MLRRSALIGLLAAAVTVIFVSAASASISPGMTLEQGATATSAGSSVPIGIDIKSNATIADRLETLTIGLPTGLLINLDTNGGACVASAAPSPLCQLGSGTINGATGTPFSLYLVAAPTPSGIVQNLVAQSQPLAAVAGVALVLQGGETLSGAVTLTSSPAVALNLVFSSIPSATNVKELQLAFASMRLPTSCGPASLTLQASSWQGGSGAASAPLAVSGCGSLPYSPTVAAIVHKQSGSSGAVIEVQFTQGAGEAAIGTLEFGNPPGVKLNKVLAPCFNGVECTVGTVDAKSPLLPASALESGELTLAGSVNRGNPSQAISGSLTMSFPPPFAFTVSGPLDIAEKMLSFSNVPDIPLSSLTFDFTGIPAGPAFTTECEPGTIAATVLSHDGNPAIKITGPVTNLNCPPPGAKPSVSGSLGGLASGRPQLRVRATRGSNAPDIASLSVSLPSGLGFAHRAIGTRQSCRSTHGRHTCTTSPSLRGFSLSGATLAKARMQGGALVLTFAHPAGNVSLLARGPLLTESKALKRSARQHKAGSPAVRVRITDAKGTSTVVSVP